MLVLIPQPEPAPVKPAEPKRLEPVEVSATLVVFDEGTGTGCLAINDEPYFVKALVDADGQLVGYQVVCRKTNGKVKRHEIDTTEGWPRCNCEDAIYRPDRPGGCRHLRALADLKFVCPIPMPEESHASHA